MRKLIWDNLVQFNCFLVQFIIGEDFILGILWVDFVVVDGKICVENCGEVVNIEFFEFACVCVCVCVRVRVQVGNERVVEMREKAEVERESEEEDLKDEDVQDEV